MKIMKKINTQEIPVKRLFASLCMAVAMVLAFAGCIEEDIVQPTNGQAGTLHITSVSVDGQQVGGKSRVAYGEGVTHSYNYNRSITEFTEDDALTLEYKFDGSNNFSQVAATLTDEGTWSMATIVPGTNQKWGDISMNVSLGNSNVVASDQSSGYAEVCNAMGILQGNVPLGSSKIWGDWLYASTETTSGAGSIVVDTDLNSPTLGAARITFKHRNRALLRLPVSAVSVTPGTYVVDGIAHELTGLGTLWAEVQAKVGEQVASYYYPLSKVTIGSTDYLQAMVATEGFSLAGFKAVLYTPESGKPGDEGYNASKVFTLDLPFKVGTAASTGMELAENTQYPLTLTISPRTSSVSMSSSLGKPGWGTDNELSNEANDNFFDARFIPNANPSTTKAMPGTFEVNTPKGLILVSQWMNGDVLSGEIKGIENVPNLDKIEEYLQEYSENYPDGYEFPEEYGYQSGYISYAPLNKDSLRFIHNIEILNDLDFTKEPKEVTVGEFSAHMRPIGEVFNYNGETMDRYWATSLNAELKGNNKTITGLTIVSQQSYAGLLAYMGHLWDHSESVPQSGFVSDLTFHDGCIGLAPLASGKDYSPWYYAGMAAGWASEGVMSNVKATGTITIKMLGEESVSEMHVGALVGEASGHSDLLIKECTNEATLTVTGKAERSYVGGIVGSQGGNLFNCVNRGAIHNGVITSSGENINAYVGGVVGSGSPVASANFANSITSVTDGTTIGGIVGSGDATGCYTVTSDLPVSGSQEVNGSYAVASEADIDEDKVSVMNAAIIEAYKETTLKPLVWYLVSGTLLWKEHTWSN